MRKIFSLFLVFLFCGGFLFAQDKSVSLSNVSTTNFKVLKQSNAGLTFETELSKFSFVEEKTDAGNFVRIVNSDYMKTFNVGYPDLPVLSKLMEIPQGATLEVKILSSEYEDVSLADLGISAKIIPAQPTLSKSVDKIPFELNSAAYLVDNFTEKPLVSTEYSGEMRGIRIARLEVSPFAYNPVKNILRVYKKISAEISFKNADLSKTESLRSKYFSPYFESTGRMFINHQEPSKALITNTPVKMVIVANPMFQATLQPFIAWKKKKGFIVTEAYTNNSAVGNTTNSIKSYLAGLYNNPPSGEPAPSFVIFVGDVAQMPTWDGTSDSHKTDLYYCEYTGDKIPEVFYGRFSATNAAELQPQIDKTLEYEQFTMPNSAFLNEVVMTAGADASHQMTWGNGQINYGTTYYFNSTNGITSHTYLQPEPGSGNYSQNIIANVSNGVGYANYTAHCSPDGWADPSFTVSDVAGLQNAHKYPLMVGNCCQSNQFNNDVCFGEAVLRAANKGAIGYIGGTNSSYWDEDFWWGCGFKDISANPTYNAQHLGAYDITFHSHNEPTSSWFVTQGQMVVGGNLAVEQSTSPRKVYYWEIYMLMGDPSVMIYFSNPPVLTANYQNTVLVGMNSLTINSEPYAYAALSLNGTLLGTAIAGADGTINLTFPPISTVGTADLVITRQNRRPHIATITLAPASGPFVTLTNYSASGTVNNNATLTLNTKVKNVGVATANNVNGILRSNDPFVTITDSTHNFGTINPNDTLTANNAFGIQIHSNIPDQHSILFSLVLVGDSTWTSQFTLLANAPVLSIGNLVISDPMGNNNGILDPGETADIKIKTSNIGHASISNLTGTIIFASTGIVVNTGTSNIPSLAVNDSAYAVFNVTATQGISIGTPFTMTYRISDGNYSAEEQKTVVVGLIPEYNMANTTVTTQIGKFYDTGGPTNTYNNNEELVMTFLPSVNGGKTRVTFNDFETESSYDFLKVYDGNSTNATLIGTFDGSNSPGEITATNEQGALTFEFSSDGSVNKAGWYADISCYFTAPIAGQLSGPTSAICKGTTATLNLTGSAGDVQWQKTENLANAFVNIDGATGISYTSDAIFNTTFFRASITRAGQTIYTDTIEVEVKDIPLSGTAASVDSLGICAGNSVTLNLNGATGDIQWQYATSLNGTYSNATGNGATTSTFVSENLNTTTYFRANLNLNGCSVLSNVVEINVKPQANAGELRLLTSTDTLVCENSVVKLVLNNSVGNLQWQVKQNSDFVDIPNADSIAFETESLTSNTIYRVVASQTGNGCVNSTSNEMLIKVNLTPQKGTISMPDAYVCKGGSTVLTLSDYVGNISWQKTSLQNGNFSTILNEKDSVFNTPVLTTTTYYRIMLSNAKCPTVFTDTLAVEVRKNSLGGKTSATDKIVCLNGTTTLTVTDQVADAVKWQKSFDGKIFEDVTGGIGKDSVVYVSENISKNIYFRVVASQNGAGCTDANSAITFVKLNIAPDVKSIPAQYITKGQPFAPISLNKYVVDDQTDTSKILWTSAASEIMNIAITNKMANVSVADTSWTGLTQIMFIATDICGLKDSNLVSLKVTAPANVENVENQVVAIVYPNPSLGEFSIKMNRTTVGKVTLKISNIQGQTVVMKQLILSSDEHIEKMNIKTNGIYTLQLIENNEVIYQQKLIIE